MKSPNLFIITFILFLTDLNDSVSATKLVRKPIIHPTELPANSSAPKAPPFTGRPKSTQSPSNLESSPNLPDNGLKVVSVTKALTNNTTITSDEHLTNESSVSKELSKNLLNHQEQKNQELKNKQAAATGQLPKKISKPLLANSTVALYKAGSNSTGGGGGGGAKQKVVDECPKTQFDYLVLSLSWPVNICSQRACVVSPQRWFIHNLSPLFHLLQDNNQISQCCKKRPFNTSELGPITSELKEHMQSVLATKPDETFWFEEWTTVGACFRSNDKLNTIHKYFGETVRLYKEIDLAAWLLEKNIKPMDDINNVYDSKAFYQAIHAKRPYKFQLKCSPMPGKQSISIIEQVNFCFDKELVKINCPAIESMKSTCKDQLLFPTFDTPIVVEKRSGGPAYRPNSKASSLGAKKARRVNVKNQLHSLGAKQFGWVSVTTKENLSG